MVSNLKTLYPGDKKIQENMRDMMTGKEILYVQGYTEDTPIPLTQKEVIEKAS